MVQTSDRPTTLSLSFEQYISGDFDYPWSDCVLVDGEIVEVLPESGQNNRIAFKLAVKFELYSEALHLNLGICLLPSALFHLHTQV